MGDSGGFAHLLREIPNRYTQLDVLYLDGHKGGVVKAVDTLTNEFVAVKLIPRDKVQTQTLNEILALKKLKHPNIVEFKRVIMSPQYLGIVMEYLKDGCVKEYLDGVGVISEDEARIVFQQMVVGLHFCMRNGIANRDIKLENALLVKDILGGFKHVVKLCDFGFAKDITQSVAKTAVGTMEYIAPEIMIKKAQDAYNAEKSDVWSLAVSLLWMLNGFCPFSRPEDPPVAKGQPCRILMTRINAVDFVMPVTISQGGADLISRMLQRNPQQRASLSDVVSHPWFQTNLPQQLASSLENPALLAEQTTEEICRLINSISIHATPMNQSPPRDRPMGQAHQTQGGYPASRFPTQDSGSRDTAATAPVFTSAPPLPQAWGTPTHTMPSSPATTATSTIIQNPPRPGASGQPLILTTKPHPTTIVINKTSPATGSTGMGFGPPGSSLEATFASMAAIYGLRLRAGDLNSFGNKFMEEMEEAAKQLRDVFGPLGAVNDVNIHGTVQVTAKHLEAVKGRLDALLRTLKETS